MVVRGNFSVRLVQAETKQPFKEHYCRVDGKTFVEVEPDIEYFIEIWTIGGQQTGYFQTYVDGEYLNYCTPVSPGCSTYCGIYSRSNGRHIARALKFLVPKNTKAPSVFAANNQAQALAGTIVVTVHEAIFDQYVPAVPCISEVAFSSKAVVATSLIGPDTKKMLRSQSGSKSESVPTTTGYERVYKPGRLLETFELHYCSALGLIKANILPEPPAFSWNQAPGVSAPLLRRTANADNPILPNIQPILIQQKAVVVNGSVVTPAKAYELFDLADLPDDGD